MRNPIMPRQPFIEEGIVSFDQFEHVTVLAQNALEERLGFVPKRLPQVIVEIWKETHIGNHTLQISQVKPLSCKIVDQRP